MLIQSRLQPNEKVLSEFAPFYATSLRVIRLAEGAPAPPQRGWRELLGLGKPPPAPPPFLELPYSQLAGVKLVSEPRHQFMMAGTVMVILGLGLLVIPLIMGMVVIAVGIGVLALGAKGQSAYYQLEARHLPPETARFWRIPYARSGSFVATVRQVIGQLPEF